MKEMNRINSLILTIVVILNIMALLFYYSPISLYGYWPDTLFLLIKIIITLFLLKQIKNKFIKTTLKTISIINLVIVCITSFSLYHFLVPVHYIPAGYFEDKKTYAYFIERGNLGITNGCYGEIQYNKQILWLPFIEIKTETDNCSTITYENIINGT